jgi:hypothetical protein
MLIFYLLLHLHLQPGTCHTAICASGDAVGCQYKLVQFPMPTPAAAATDPTAPASNNITSNDSIAAVPLTGPGSTAAADPATAAAAPSESPRPREVTFRDATSGTYPVCRAACLPPLDSLQKVIPIRTRLPFFSSCFLTFALHYMLQI